MSESMVNFFLVLLFLLSFVSSEYLTSKVTSEHELDILHVVAQLQSPGPYGNDVEVIDFVSTFESFNRLRVSITPRASALTSTLTNISFFRLPEDYLLDRTQPHMSANACAYKVSVSAEQSTFQFNVTRTDTKQVVFSSDKSLTMATQYLEISNQFSVSNPYVYGLGERDFQLRMAFDTPYTMFAFDTAPTNSTEWQYGVHPFYMELNPEDGTAVGVLLWNSHAMEVVLSSSGKMTYKVVGGALDFFIFIGNSPADVVRQYTQLIGRPYLPPRWSLGFHQCRWGYNSTAQTSGVVDEFMKNSLPLDAIWNDIDYMHHYNDFTLDPFRFNATENLAFDLSLAAMNKHHVYIVDPAIPMRDYAPYNTGLEQDIFITRWNQSHTPTVGKVWPPQPIVFPDFSNPAAADWWRANIAEWFQQGVRAEGLWIDMNEPSNFVDGEYPFHKRLVVGPAYSENSTTSPDHELMIQWGRFVNLETERLNAMPVTAGVNIPCPPFLPGAGRVFDDYGVMESLEFHTASMSAQQAIGRHYNAHSLYGYHEAIATRRALETLNQKRAFVLTRSTFVGSGQYASHWTGDNNANPISMASSIPHILSFSLFGISHVGSDICGFNDNTNEELCTRWMQLGAFYPFSRNHNSWNTTAQEPYAFGPASTVLAASLASLRLRYRLLPTLYTLFAAAALRGDTVARPVFFEFPRDRATLELDRETGQFLLGGSLMVVPVLAMGVLDVEAYMPDDDWFVFPGGRRLATIGSGGHTISLTAPLSTVLPLAMRGGAIFVTMTDESVRLNVEDTMAGTLDLVVALRTPTEETQVLAEGSLYWDAGDSVDPFNAIRPLYQEWSLVVSYSDSSYELTIRRNVSLGSNYVLPSTVQLERITLYGVSQTILSSHVDSSVSGKREKLNVQSDMNLHTAVISGLSGKLNLMDQSCVIFFSAQHHHHHHDDYDYRWVLIVVSAGAAVVLLALLYSCYRRRSLEQPLLNDRQLEVDGRDATRDNIQYSQL